MIRLGIAVDTSSGIVYRSVDAIGIASGSLSGQNVGENSKKYSSARGWLRRMRGIFFRANGYDRYSNNSRQ